MGRFRKISPYPVGATWEAVTDAGYRGIIRLDEKTQYLEMEDISEHHQ